MSKRVPYRTAELSDATWPDFETLFSRGNGWDHCWCMAGEYRPQPLPKGFGRLTRAERAVRNHADRRELVRQGRAHDILVYAGGQPIGWCRFGPTEGGLWTVTCFVVDKRHRRRGVAGLALRGALEAIRARGGDLVEAYPIAAWTHGRERRGDPVQVPGVGPVAPAWGNFANVSFRGTVSMFEQQGFQPVAVCGRSSRRVTDTGARGDQVLMRRRT